MKTFTFKKIGIVLTMWLAFLSNSFATDLSILGAYYTQAKYVGNAVKGTYKLELTKDNYAFKPGQFSINITLPLQGSYDPSRAAEAVIPAGWQLTVTTNNSLILSPTVNYEGTGASVNRRKDFFLPIITSAVATDQPTLATIDWADPNVEEASTGNSAGSVLNVSSSALPVDLISFNVHKQELTASLNWVTAKEVNSDRFDIQHSLNGKEWISIGSVSSDRDEKKEHTYSFNHSKPAAGINYYRLKMIDTDLKFAFSSIRNITFDNIVSLKLYPNPVSDEVIIEMTDWNKVNQIKIFNLAGSPVYNSGISVKNKVNVSNLLSGIYLMNIEKTDGSHVTSKFIINR